MSIVPTSTPTAITYSETTLTAPLTTVITTESLFTSNGQEQTTTLEIATVIPSGTKVIDQGVEGPKKKSNLVVIIAAALGGFIGVVLIAGVIFCLRRSSQRKAKLIPPSPSLRLSSPPLPPPVPFGYQQPQDPQPRRESRMTTESRRDEGHIYYPPQTMSEKRQRQFLQHGALEQPRDTYPRPSMDDTGSSVVSQPYTMSSGYSASAPLGPNPATMHRAHQRSMSANSEMSFGATSEGRSLAGSMPPNTRVGPSPSYFAGAPAPMGPVHEEEAVRARYSDGSSLAPMMPPPGSPPGPPQQSYEQQPRDMLHAYQSSSSMRGQDYGGASSSAAAASSSSNWDAGGSSGAAGSGSGASATVDRGDGTTAQVFPAKNSTIRRPHMRGVDEVDESLTNLSEIPPSYDSLQQQRARRMMEG